MSRCLGTKSVGACLDVLPAPAPAPSARELSGKAHQHCCDMSVPPSWRYGTSREGLGRHPGGGTGADAAGSKSASGRKRRSERHAASTRDRHASAEASGSSSRRILKRAPGRIFQNAKGRQVRTCRPVVHFFLPPCLRAVITAASPNRISAKLCHSIALTSSDGDAPPD